MSIDDDGVAYLRLPGHRGTSPGIVKKTVTLRELLGDYSGGDLHFDFMKITCSSESSCMPEGLLATRVSSPETGTATLRVTLNTTRTMIVCPY